MKTPLIKTDDTLLLSMLLKKNKLTRKQWDKQCQYELGINQAALKNIEQRMSMTKVIPKSGVPAYSVEYQWETEKYNITTTKYGRVKSYSKKMPTVTIRRKRHLAGDK